MLSHVDLILNLVYLGLSWLIMGTPINRPVQRDDRQNGDMSKNKQAVIVNGEG